MDTQPPPTIISFVVRFVVEAPGAPGAPGPTAAPLRGSIQHVQSDEALHFSGWQEAVDFIQRFVPLETAPQE